MKNLKPGNEIQERLKDKKGLESLFERNRYLIDLQNCDNSEFFKSYLIFASAALDSYLDQSKNQAKESFVIAKWFSIAGFIIIAIGVCIGFYTAVEKDFDDNFLSLVTTGSGIVTEIIAATIFLLYTKTLKQFNVSLNKITEMQNLTLPILEKQIINNPQKESK